MVTAAPWTTLFSKCVVNRTVQSTVIAKSAEVYTLFRREETQRA